MLRKENKDTKMWANNGMLNKPGFNSTASYAYKIDLPNGKVKIRGYNGYPHAEFHISGCSRDAVELEFEVASGSGFNNALFKVDTLLEALTDFRRDLMHARAHMQDRKKRLEKLKEADKVKKAEKNSKKPTE